MEPDGKLWRLDPAVPEAVPDIVKAMARSAPTPPQGPFFWKMKLLCGLPPENLTRAWLPQNASAHSPRGGRYLQTCTS